MWTKRLYLRSVTTEWLFCTECFWPPEQSMRVCSVVKCVCDHVHQSPGERCCVFVCLCVLVCVCWWASRRTSPRSVFKCFLMSWHSYRWSECVVGLMGGMRKQPEAVVWTLIIFISGHDEATNESRAASPDESQPVVVTSVQPAASARRWPTGNQLTYCSI